MINRVLFGVFLLVLYLSSLQGVIYEVRDLSKFEQEVSKLDATGLVLFDVDYTLLIPKDISLRPCGKGLRRQYLYVLDPERRELLQSITALEGEEELMDCSFPSLIQRMQRDNISAIGFTALETGKYGKIENIEDWRLSQLKKFNIDFSSSFADKNLLTLDKISPYNSHHPLFKNGVLFTNQLLKGEVIIAFLEKIDWKPSVILFIDDSLDQLKSTEAAANVLGIEFIGFHYIAALTSQNEFDQKLGEFQFQNLVENERWLTDVEAKKLLKQQACDSMKNSPQIIYINGPSSSGKTTLAKSLQQEFDQPFLHIGIDRVIGMMPEKLNNWEGGSAPLGFSWKESVDETGHPIHEIQSGPFAKKMVETLMKIVITMADMGHYIIIDDVSFGKCQVDQWRKVLDGYKVLWIGIKAPLNTLEEREKARGNRMPGSARAQYFQVHTDVSYDLEFDTSKDSLENIIRIIKMRYADNKKEFSR